MSAANAKVTQQRYGDSVDGDTYLFLHPGATLQLSSNGLLIRSRLENRLEESLPVTVLIFRCFVANSPLSRRFSFCIRGSQQWSSQIQKYPSLQTIDMNERKTGTMTGISSTYQEITTRFCQYVYGREGLRKTPVCRV